MPRKSKKHNASNLDKAKALPWAAVLQGVVVVGRRWKGLTAKDRERLKQLLAESGGHVSSLSSKQQKELRKLAGKLDLKGMGRELLALRGRRGRKRV
jgi:hypothetical protein